MNHIFGWAHHDLIGAFLFLWKLWPYIAIEHPTLYSVMTEYHHSYLSYLSLWFPKKHIFVSFVTTAWNYVILVISLTFDISHWSCVLNTTTQPLKRPCG